MQKKYCDKCGAELEPEEGKGIMLVKTYKAYFFHRNIFTMEKEAYNDKEYCEDCYFSLINTKCHPSITPMNDIKSFIFILP